MINKKLFSFILCLSSLSVFSCNSQSDKNVMLIQTLYVKNDSLWRYENNPVKLKQELTLLYKEFCSAKFEKELFDELQRMGLDHDFITMDWLMDENSIKSMKIQKVSEYVYHVSYTTKMEDPMGKMRMYNIVLCVKLTKEENEYIIDDITDITNV